MERVGAVVAGAGVVGLAVARALALAGHEVVLLEAGEAIGTGTSSRNSEVVHAGLYYAPGSLKARLCVEGRRALYAYCRERGIPARATAKLLVATGEDQLPALAALRATAEANGVDDLAPLDPAGIAALEPEVAGVAALLSPSSGIVDSHALMLALRGDLEEAGGFVALNAPVMGGAVAPGGVRLVVGGPGAMEIEARLLVNAAGLHAAELARSILGLPAETVPRTHLAKGSYFALTGTRAPFRRLVYPLPEPGGLGVHATVDLAGAVRFGPDVEWVDRVDYSVDPARAAGFYAAIRRYWPGLPDGSLAPAYAGIRPKLAGPGEPAADFLVQGSRDHGVPGLVNLYGVESPGLTASLALGALVAGMGEAARG